VWTEVHDIHDDKLTMPGDAPIEVPIDRLSREALLGIIDDFVLREGTEYGHADVPLETKRQQVLVQLCAGEVVVMFDPETKTSTIVPRPA